MTLRFLTEDELCHKCAEPKHRNGKHAYKIRLIDADALDIPLEDTDGAQIQWGFDFIGSRTLDGWKLWYRDGDYIEYQFLGGFQHDPMQALEDAQRYLQSSHTGLSDI